MSFREKKKNGWQAFALELVPGSRCQLKCGHCYKSQTCRQVGDMPYEFALDALRQANECGFKEAVFIGGEPTLHRHLPELVQESLQLDMTPIVVSNGVRLATRSYADKIALLGVTIVLHAPLPEDVQDEHVRTPGYHQKLLQAYEHVVRHEGVTVVAEAVVIEEFIPHLEATYQWCQERGVIPFFEIIRRGDDGQHLPSTCSPEQVHDLFARLPNQPTYLFPPAFGQACTMSITGVHVKNFGNGDFGGVYSCCAQQVRHGDLRYQSLAEILTDPLLVVFKDQDEWIYGPCRECEHYSICRGGCRGDAYLAFGCPRATEPSCWHIPTEARNDPSVMLPPTCVGCPLEGNSTCHPQRSTLSAIKAISAV